MEISKSPNYDDCRECGISIKKGIYYQKVEVYDKFFKL